MDGLYTDYTRRNVADPSLQQSASYVYPPTTPDPSNDFITDNPSLYSFDTYSPLDDNAGNALGLDLPPPAHPFSPSPQGYDDVTYYSQAHMSQLGSPIPRQHLPQIITDGLRPVEASPHERSPLPPLRLFGPATSFGHYVDAFKRGIQHHAEDARFPPAH